MKAGTINETWRDSHVADLSSRINYLEDLLMNYFPTLHDIFDGGEESLIHRMRLPWRSKKNNTLGQ